MKMERFSTFLNEGYGLKDRVCYKILFKIIIVTINGILKIVVLVELIIGNNLNRVGSNPKIGIPNLVSKP